VKSRQRSKRNISHHTSRAEADGAMLADRVDLENVFSYEDYESALSQVEAVYLALPNHLHREFMVRAAKAGVHVGDDL
jgi:predicted dehydrogenase